jgi:serine/threonine protein kinase
MQGELDGDQGLTKTGTILGTPYYMSPEQAKGQQVDEQIDIWAAGVILYEMLAGQLPYSGESYNQVLSDILLEIPRPLSELASEDARGLIPIVEKAMKKNKSERYKSASEMIHDLMKFSDMAFSDQTMVESTKKAIKHSIAPPPPSSAENQDKTVNIGPNFSAKNENTPDISFESDISKPAKGSNESDISKPAKGSKRNIFLILLIPVIALALIFLFFSHKGQSTTDIYKNIIGFWTTEIKPLKNSVPKISISVKMEKGTNQTTTNTTDSEKKSDNASSELQAVAAGSDTNTDSTTAAATDTETDTTADTATEQQQDSDSLSETVTIKFNNLPSKARLFINGKKAKAPLILPRSHKTVKIKIKPRHRKSITLKITPDKNQTIKIKRRSHSRRK